jgi:hypothetical protein
MPQKRARERVETTICQECLQREMGNWFECEPGAEMLEMASSALSCLAHDGKCGICGKSNYTLEDYPPIAFYDCLSEELEIEGFEQNVPGRQFLQLN